MDRLLLLMTTTTYRAGAFLDAARRVGVPVTVGSERPQALASSNPAGHLTLDFANTNRSVAAIESFARHHPLGAIVAADDDGVMLAARAAHALGLRHHSIAAVSAARDKHRMRERLAAAGVPCPRFERLSIAEDFALAAERMRYPCVLKPLSLSASRGVIRADDAAQFVAAFGRIAAMIRGRTTNGAAPEAALLVEEYIPGAEVALEGLVTSGSLRTLAIFDKPDPMEGPFFEETIYVTPSRLDRDTQQAIEARTAEVVAALDLSHGPIHAELRVNERGIWPLEIAPRPIGGLCSRTLRFGQGRTLEEIVLCHVLGLEGADLERENLAAGVMMIPIPLRGILRRVTGEDEAQRVPDVEDVRITIPIGDEVVPLPEGARYLGFLFARAETPGRVEAALREAHRRLTFDIQPSGAAPLRMGPK